MLEIEENADASVLTITVNRPPVNAWVEEGYAELSAAIERVNASETVSAVVLRATGPMFSAGADVKRLASDSPYDAARRRPILRKACFDVAECQVPVVAAVHGHAVGVGAALAAAADVMVASHDAHFSIPEIKVGVVGAAAAMRKIVPEHMVRSMALTGRPVSSRKLYELGVIDELCGEDELHSVAHEKAVTIAEAGVLAVRKWKEALVLTDPGGGRDALLVEQCLGQELTLLSEKPKIN